VLKFLFYTSVELKHMKKHAMCNVGREKIKQTEHSSKNVQALLIPVLNVQIQQSPIS
jgi:hypothetical protein